MATTNNVEAVLLSINIAVKEAMESTVQILIEELKSIIDKKVYGAYSPEWYQRSYDFRESWDSTSATMIGNMVEAEIFHDDNLLTYNAEKWQHGNIINRLEPDGLPTIINEGRIGSGMGFPQLGEREYWETFNTYIDGNLKRILMEELAKKGL